MDLTSLTDIANQPALVGSTIFQGILLSLVLGIFISWVHERLNQGFSYERSFSITLVMVTMIASCVMVAIGSNIALSLGLIGALSIIRFRAVLKNTLDMAYLFWGISVGIAIGSKTYFLAFAFSLTLALVLFVIHKKNLLGKVNEDYVAIITTTSGLDPAKIEKIINQYTESMNLRSASVNPKSEEAEYIYSFTTRKSEQGFGAMLGNIENVDEVQNVSVFSPNTNINV